jgi:hypothetical protein
VAAPQVWWVSHRMGGFAINGRQVWSLMSNQPGDSSQQDVRERLFGLDYSPSMPNLFYVQANPEARAELASGTPPAEFIKLVLRNIEGLYWQQLPELVGPGVIALFLFGLLGLWRGGGRVSLLIIAGFLGATLMAPLLHMSLSIRHLAILAPLLLLLAGEGIVTLVSLSLGAWSQRMRGAVATGLAVVILALCVLPVRDAIGRAYDPALDAAALQEPAAIVRDIQARELQHPAVVAARRVYLAQAAGTLRPILLPYTDLDGLMRYLRLNEADFVFLEYDQLVSHEFISDFLSGNVPDDLTLIYQGETSQGSRLELYRLKRPED